MKNALHKEATLEATVGDSVEATVTETTVEVSNVEDMHWEDQDYDDDIALMLQQEEEEAIRSKEKEQENTEKKSKPAKMDKSKSKHDEPEAAAVATSDTTAASEHSEYTTSMDTVPEEKDKNHQTSLKDTVTGATGKRKKYPPRMLRAHAKEKNKKPTSVSRKSNSSTATKVNSSKKSNSTTKQSSKGPEKVAKNNEEEEEEEDNEAPEYEVEKIEGHRIYKGKVVKYEIKWKGYPQEDNTMEAASTVHDDVPGLCIAYWDSQPNIPRPSNAPVGKITVSESSSDANTPIPTAFKEIKKEQAGDNRAVEQTLVKKTSRKRELEHVVDSKLSKRIKQYVDHVPGYMVRLGYQFPTVWPLETTNWEDELKKICIQASPIDPKIVLCYIEWGNDNKTIHTMDEAHEKIPVALIKYYEERLQFV